MSDPIIRENVRLAGVTLAPSLKSFITGDHTLLDEYLLVMVVYPATNKIVEEFIRFIIYLFYHNLFFENIWLIITHRHSITFIVKPGNLVIIIWLQYSEYFCRFFYIHSGLGESLFHPRAEFLQFGY